MTAISTSPSVPRVEIRHRVVKVMRLHLVNRLTYIGIPWIITGVALVVSIVIALLISASTPEADRQQALEGMSYSWAVLSPLWYLAVVGVQAVSAVFPFAMGFSITRREYALGTLLTYLVIAAVNATGWAVLTEIERAVNASGVVFHHFTALWLGEAGVGTVWLSLFSLQVLIFAVTSAFGAVYARWRAMGMLVLWVAVALAVLGILAVAVLTGAAPPILDWLFGLPSAGFFAALLIPAAVAFALGWGALRRAPLRG
ncbi:hypothetical protein K2F54_15970 [Cryobacterium sp. 1639]|uniref:hypothetical protein n=1 Tax=Cryobacterium inferilacus TaxID=2866629 RepID=UPI001C72FF78|nr:hypothetical protein [Cryobacterium sp. 1639]MBX0301471.1 hypothetical protein [Cryobacterium sp. 1639]